jgi:hypothetical protein
MKKTTNNTKSEYHNTVVPAFVAYRKQMEKALNVPKQSYTQMFTERRAKGARTKYWIIGQNMPSLQAYVTKNPTFTAGNTVYKVTCKDHYAAESYYPGIHTSLYCEKLNPIQFSK